MGKTVDIKISTNSINKTLRNYYRAIEGMTVDALENLTKEMEKEAKKNVKQVGLDGQPVEIKISSEQIGPRSFEVVASGRDALFAEYGTGVYYGDNYPGVNPYGPGSYGPKGLQPYWYYYLKSGNQFGAGGEYAKSRGTKVKNYYDYFGWFGEKGKRIEAKGKDSPEMRLYREWVKRDFGSRGVPLQVFKDKLSKEETIASGSTKKDVGITHGNRPYAYMYNAFLKVANKATKLAKKSYDWSYIYK